jgi:hypothetical protein
MNEAIIDDTTIMRPCTAKAKNKRIGSGAAPLTLKRAEFLR